MGIIDPTTFYEKTGLISDARLLVFAGANKLFVLQNVCFTKLTIFLMAKCLITKKASGNGTR